MGLCWALVATVAGLRSALTIVFAEKWVEVERLAGLVPTGGMGKEGEGDLAKSGLGTETLQLMVPASLVIELLPFIMFERVGGGGEMGGIGEFGEFRRSVIVEA